jgi:hypothetical protein
VLGGGVYCTAVKNKPTKDIQVKCPILIISNTSFKELRESVGKDKALINR